MTFTPEVESLINKAVGKMNFSQSTCLTPEQKVLQADKAIRSLVRALLVGAAKTVTYYCDGCKVIERLNEVHDNPMHRHGKTLFLLRRKNEER